MHHQNRCLADSFEQSFFFGLISTLIVWSLFWSMKSEHTGWSATPKGLLYNVPISFPFFVLCWEMLFSFRHRSFVEGIKNNAAYLLVWIVGAVILYLRLVTETIQVSGHMTWLMIMPVWSALRKLPLGFTLFIIIIAIQAGYFNFVLFPSIKSGLWGVVFGAVLSCFLVILVHIHNKRASHGTPHSELRA
jgi:hypothetical protein